MKKTLIYALMFIAFFLCGLLLAFGWQKIVTKKRAAPIEPTPQALSQPAIGAHKLPPAPTPLTKTTPATPHTGPEPQLSAVQQPPTEYPVTATSAVSAPSAGAGCDIILLMDSSGSMKRTDPKNYRKDAAKLLISLLGKDDRVGVMSFGDSAVRLVPLTPNTEQNRSTFLVAVEKISSKALFTNITDAVRAGYDELKASHRRDRLMVMMSDGKIDLGSKEKDDASVTVLRQVLPELAKENIKLYTVAFTEESDAALLENMAQKTGGFFRFAAQDKDVHQMFASIFEKIKAPDTVPFDGEAFMIDRDIREATVLVTKKPGAALSVMDPSNGNNTASQHAPNMAWFESSVFDILTIQEPAAGTWRVSLGVNEGNRVYVLTNLSLKTSFDRNFVNKGEELMIDAWLEKQSGVVTEKYILDSTAFFAEIDGPGGKPVKLNLATVATSTGARQATGKYAATFPAASAGEYTVKVFAQGKTFMRGKTIPFKVVEPLAALPAERKPLTMPVAAPTQAVEGIPWTQVLIRWGIVNLFAIVLAVGGYFLKKKVLKERK